MPTTDASRYSNRLSLVRTRGKPKGQPAAINKIAQRMYAEADQLCFGNDEQVAVIFEDASLLVIDRGAVQVPRYDRKARFLQWINALPESERHHPRSLSESGPYQKFAHICLSTLNPRPAPSPSE